MHCQHLSWIWGLVTTDEGWSLHFNVDVPALGHGCQLKECPAAFILGWQRNLIHSCPSKLNVKMAILTKRLMFQFCLNSNLKGSVPIATGQPSFLFPPSFDGNHKLHPWKLWYTIIFCAVSNISQNIRFIFLTNVICTPSFDLSVFPLN